MIEIWHPIPGYKGFYASNMGDIKSPKRGVHKGNLNKKGYYIFTIKGKSQGVHRWILLAFLGPSKLHCNHKNGIKSDNRLDNLEYVTQAENNAHAVANNLWPKIGGEQHARTHLTEKDIIAIRKSKLGNVELGLKYNVNRRTISAIRCRVNWKHVKDAKWREEK